MRNRKAEEKSGANVYTLVILIALFIVLYLIIIPPEDRDALLNNTYDDDDNGDNGEEFDNETLLLKSPGIVYPTREGEVEHDINQLSLFIKTEPEINTLANSLYINKGLFGEQDQKVTFGVDDIANLKDLILSFTVIDPKGRLIVKLNNNVVSESSFASGSQIIRLPENYIREENRLEFSVSSPGVEFWAKNHYRLDTVVLKKEFTLVNSQEERWFSVSEGELDSLKRSRLRYFLYCTDLDDTARLKILLNNNILSSEIVQCVSKEMSADIDEDFLKEGRNKLIFSIDDGDFLINDIRVINELTEKIYKIYYFDLDSDDYDKIVDNEANVILNLNLIDNNKLKEAEIRINDKILNVNTNRDSYSKEIPVSFLDEGENMVKIIPKTEFEIDMLKITLEEE